MGSEKDRKEALGENRDQKRTNINRRASRRTKSRRKEEPKEPEQGYRGRDLVAFNRVGKGGLGKKGAPGKTLEASKGQVESKKGGLKNLRREDEESRPAGKDTEKMGAT